MSASGTPCRLLQRFQAHHHPLPIAASPALVVEDGLEQIAVFGIERLQPIDELTARIPDRGGGDLSSEALLLADRARRTVFVGAWHALGMLLVEAIEVLALRIGRLELGIGDILLVTPTQTEP